MESKTIRVMKEDNKIIWLEDAAITHDPDGVLEGAMVSLGSVGVPD